MFKRNYAVVAIATVSLMLAFAPTVQTETFLGGIGDLLKWLLNPLVILVEQLLGGELTPVEQALVGNCSEYPPANVTLAMLKNKTWHVVKTNSSSTCSTSEMTPIIPGSLVSIPLPGLETYQNRISYMESGQNLTKFYTMTTLVKGRGQYLIKQFPSSLTSPAAVNQTLETHLFVVLNHSDTTMMAVICPIQPIAKHRAVHIWTSNGMINPEVAEFEQQARNQGVDLHNFHAVNNSVCSFSQ